ncbi:MAG: NHLP bacteriocin export ABC transporter permease/ATPase subunit [Pseudomonadota bacterium]
MARKTTTIDQRAGPAQDAAVIDQMARSAAKAQDTLQRSLTRLASVVGAKAGPATAASPAASAVLAVLERSGFDARRSGVALDRLTLCEDVSSAAHLLGARKRRLVLPTEWWRGEHGDFIGFLADSEDSADEARPVALLKQTGRGYVLFDPELGTEQPVDQNLAASITPFGWMIYLSMPEEISGVGALLRMVLPVIRRDLQIVALAGLVAGLVGALIPIATGFIVDSIIPSGRRLMLAEIAFALLVAAGVSLLFAIARETALLRIDGRASLVLRAAVWDRVLKLPASFFKGYSSGDLRQRIAGVETMRNVLVSVILAATVTAAFSVFYLGLLMFYDWRLALVALALILLIVALNFGAGLMQLRFYRRQVELAGWLSGFVFEILEGIIKLRIAGAELRAFSRWADRYADEREAIVAARRIGGHVSALMPTLSILSLATLFASAGLLTGPDFTAGRFIAFLAAFGALQAGIGGLGSAVLDLVDAIPEWQRALPVLQAEPEVPTDAADPGTLTGTVEAVGVSFGYGEAAPVLRDLNFSVAAGEHVALVGPSGSGKSTLVRLLLGLEKPDSGTVMFDGQDLAGLDTTLVRRQIGVVTQNGRVFAGTLMENIRGASPATLEQCHQACIDAGLEKDLEQFPMGLHTPLTEGGPTLSGGQRQRLLIARALLGQPRIIIFDEATSALDNRTQAIVTESLERLSITRIVVAHRLSTIRNADRICVIVDGSIVQSGSYGQLRRRKGAFAELVQRQEA